MSTNDTIKGERWMLVLTSAASLMVSLDTQVVATALPVIRVQLHASLAVLEWTVNAWAGPARRGLRPGHPRPPPAHPSYTTQPRP